MSFLKISQRCQVCVGGWVDGGSSSSSSLGVVVVEVFVDCFA